MKPQCLVVPTKYKVQHQLENQQGKRPMSTSRPSSPIQNLNTLIQKTQRLQGKSTPLTYSVYYVAPIPKMAPNIPVKIEGEAKLVDLPPQTFSNGIMDLEK